jgi:hypothetical protein
MIQNTSQGSQVVSDGATKTHRSLVPKIKQGCVIGVMH